MFDGLMPHPVRKAVATFGDGVNTHYLISHDLGTQDVLIQVWQANPPHNEVHCAAMAAVSTSACALQFASPPALDGYRVVILG